MTVTQEKAIEEIVDGVVLGANETHAFQLDKLIVRPDGTQRRYVGRWTFKRPGWAEEARIGARQAQLVSSLNPVHGLYERMDVDRAYADLALIVATLEVVVTEAPTWAVHPKTRQLHLDAVPDAEVLRAVYEEYAKWRYGFPGSPAPGPGPDRAASEEPGALLGAADVAGAPNGSPVSGAHAGAG